MNNRSFTLIELLVVIAIIGLITSVTLVAIDLPGQRQRARIAKTLEFSSSIQSALGEEAKGIWDFNEGPENSPLTIAQDSSGYGNNGACSGAACPIYKSDTPHKIVGPSSGKYSLSFDGVDDRVDGTKNIGITGLQDRTMEFWAKPNTVNFSGPYVFLVSWGAWDNFRAWSMFVYGNPAVWQIYTGDVAYSSGKQITTEWQHVVATLSSNRTAKIYVNGLQYGGDLTVSVSVNTTNSPVKIGARIDNAVFFPGLIDEVRIYAKVLTIGQIQKHYAEGLGRHQDFAIK